MKPPRRLLPLLVIAGLCLAALPCNAQKVSRRFDLTCLAPLLDRVDSAAPLNLDEAFLFGPWHAPVARGSEGIGAVDFKIATDSEAAQRWFDQGVALLHLFWYSEAERCFRQALLSDPDCPMLYWGLAMANERRPQRAAVFAEEALRYSSKRAELSAAERGWIQMLGEFYAGERATFKVKDPAIATGERTARRRQRILALEALAFAHPDEVEPEAFLLRQVILDQSQHGDPIANHHANDLLAAKIAARAPEHPSRHYRVLLWLGRDAGRAMAAADDAVKVAPAVANSWRFAGEAYRAAGQMRHAADLLGGAVRIGLKEMAIMPDLSEDLVSNFAALIDAQTSMGQFETARDTARALVRLPRSFYLEKRHRHEQRLAGSYASGRRLLGQVHLRLERWEELIEESTTGELRAGDDGDWFSLTDSLFWRGVAHAGLGQLPAANAIVEELKDAIREAPLGGANEAAKQWMVALTGSLRSQIEFAAGERERLPEDNRDTTWLTPDHLARVYFAAGLKAEAIEFIDREFAQRPGQFLTVANYADLHFQNGDSKKTLYVFDRPFRQAASLASSGLRVTRRLQPVATAMRLGPRWQLTTPDHQPLADLPAPDSLGPIDWTPPEAPAWSLPDHSGKQTSLEDFRGRPVVLNFFLGVACPFCRVQLDKFTPQLAAYREADIGFLTITRDRLEDLQTVTGSEPKKSATGKKLLPFPVFADPEMQAFKSFRAFDQFDDFPMHATFLIGPGGRLLWSDIGHAPFNHPEPLLREARRLQSQRLD